MSQDLFTVLENIELKYGVVRNYGCKKRNLS